MSATNITPTEHPGPILSACAVLAENLARINALCSAARSELSDNKYTADELLDMAEELAGDVSQIMLIGQYLGVDTVRRYAFDKDE